ncbi:MAG: hypothetical protein L3K02_05140 [Thermoplasmata archaeon]|nr:hypothetical protein [Thermoplasmata archaeon]
MVRNQGRVTRFVVMAMLQAARAKTLGLPQESAQSWGLNRAIFYEAAKRGFKQPSPTGEETERKSSHATPAALYRLGDDEAFRDPATEKLTFTIGGQAQTDAAFERQVASRFGTKENFRIAWDEAMRIVGGFDRAILESRQGFYADVYKPRRDELSDVWTLAYSPPPKKR